MPIADYAAIGDGRTVALIASDGDVDWLPVPDLDTPPVFGAIVDADRGGRITLHPVDDFTVQRSYLDGTNVLITTMRTADGEVEITESLNSGVAGRLPWTEFARSVRGVRGRVRMRWSVQPGGQWRTHSPWFAEDADGVRDPVLRVGTVQLAVCGEHHFPRRGVDLEHSPDHDGDHDTQRAGTAVHGAFTTAPDSTHLLAVIGVDDQPVPLPDPRQIRDRIRLTVEGWQSWTRQCGEELSLVETRSALALKLLVHSPTGTIAAAGTTSLPESRTVPKNWDYRYSWLRDTSFAVSALQRLGLREEVHAATSRLLRTLRDDGPVPPIFTTLSGGAPSGHEESMAPGWDGIGPVVIGNAAADQLQLGVFGDLFGLIHSYIGAGHRLDHRSARTLADMADRCCDLWRRPDAGLWELPEEAHHTSSKMGCWQALTSAAELADAGHLGGHPARWRSEAQQISRFLDEECWSEARGAYTMCAGSDKLDASVLLGHRFDRGERMSRTIDTLRRELGSGPLLWRYTGMQAEEGCFVACSFWVVVALTAVGRSGEARELLGQLHPLANDVGLFAEMIDPGTGEFLGNVPQALSHLALLDAELSLRGA
ncbi:glycoside hydrolase family 15 protein [Nakamurella alba]|uniref:glycoside hydrolase family 15 protein n=1 Tax=Nakamurella alba TaxID=2665158 RepID=UPI002AC34226|nr:glycoside hydrolase family 15 protein [Nakamurella alba]